MTSDFDRFVDSVNAGGHDWMDGFDLWALDKVVGEERARAEEMMIARLAKGDTRAIGALEALGTPSAVAAITAALASSNDEVAARAAAALVHTDPAAALRSALQAFGSPNGSARATMVQVLRGLQGDAADDALLRATDDPADNVRILATDAIFDRNGLQRFAQAAGRGLSHLWLRLVSAGPETRRQARAELSALLVQLKQGRSPEELGLVVPAPEESPALQQYLQSIRSDAGGRYAEDYDLAALDAMSAGERAWAEAALMGSLKHPADPRVPRALVHLRSQRALEPLLVCARALRAAPWRWPVQEPSGVLAQSLREHGLFVVEVARALWKLGERREAEETLRLVAGYLDPVVQARAVAALG